MLELHVADDVAPLAAALGRVLAVPLEDPFTPEWVAVPTEGTMRWLRLELARSLGASSPGAGDGVCANVRFASPGALRELVLAAPGPSAPAPGADPWDVDRLVWAVLEAARDAADDERLGPMRVLPAGATWWSRARRVAELFERYATQRPELLLQWRAGRDLDATGRGIAPGDAWQPHLWRLVRALVATPSPAERLPALLDALRSGDLAVDLPQRLAVFGVTALPGGAGFLDLLDALASTRDVRCFLVDPSPVATRRVLDAARGAPVGGIARGEDRSARAVRHPLLASWGRPYRERALLLEEAARLGRAVPRPLLAGSGRREPRTLLERLQDDLAQDRPPDGTFEPDPRDRSVQLHSCHGISRQVEVARDAILHALADDPSLCEGDVLIVCPSLAETAPVVEAVFGAPASEAGAPGAPGGRRADERRAPALSYRVADRSLRETVPVLAALDSVLELVAGRFAASAVSELLALPPVRERFGLDDAALGTLGRWIAATNVRWGLDGAHRARWGLPGELASGTWREALDRLLLGVAVGDGELELAAGSVAPVGVEGPDVELAGRFADILACLHELSDETSVAHRPQAWSAILSRAVDDLLAAPAGERWQLDAAHELLGRLGEEALVAGRPTTVELTLGDVRRALAHRLSGSPRRPDFFRGGITVSSLTPLRGLPFRVVCVVGLDDSGTAELVDGDDLVAATPRVGDRDPRGESRQALLDAVLAARDLLVVTRTGRDERTNLPVPPCVAYAELRDTVAATARARHDPTHRVDDLEVVHPRQAFDERCLQPGLLGTDGPWSFDPAALRAATARRARPVGAAALCPGALAPEPAGTPVVTLAELARFLRSPVGTFLAGRLGVRIPGADAPRGDDIETSLTGLERWRSAERLVRAVRSGHRAEDWARHERALGAIPPGGLGDLATGSIASAVGTLVALAESLGCDVLGSAEPSAEVDIWLEGGTRVVGTVPGGGSPERPGPASVTCTRPQPTHHLRDALDLAALVAADPAPSWRSVTVRRADRGEGADALVLEPVDDEPELRRAAAARLLEVVVDCYRRALREPVPLWPRISRAIYEGRARESDWRGRIDPREGDDARTRLAFGTLSLAEIRSAPARAGDPPGSAVGRADRFAHYLWEAVDSFAHPVASGAPTARAARGRPERAPRGAG